MHKRRTTKKSRRKQITSPQTKTYSVLALGNGTEYDEWGTISMDSAGMIPYMATPGNEERMAELMDESIPVRDTSPEQRGRVTPVPKPGENPEPSEIRRVVRQTDPQLWFEWLPIQYHGRAFRVVPTE